MTRKTVLSAIATTCLNPPATGTQAPVHHTAWLEAMDDSMACFFWETVALISAPMRDGAQRDDAPILSCSHLTMRFGGLLAVSDLSFSVRAGDIHGLIGPNGAGKTTIF